MVTWEPSIGQGESSQRWNGCVNTHTRTHTTCTSLRIDGGPVHTKNRPVFATWPNRFVMPCLLLNLLQLADRKRSGHWKCNHEISCAIHQPNTRLLNPCYGSSICSYQRWGWQIIGHTNLVMLTNGQIILSNADEGVVVNIMGPHAQRCSHPCMHASAHTHKFTNICHTIRGQSVGLVTLYIETWHHL